MPPVRHAAMTLAVLLATAAPAHAATTPPGVPELVKLAAQRLLLADEVAAAKFGGAGPITDPGREREVLESVAAKSADLGLPARTGVRFFRAQFQAAKLVQRGLHARWRAYPSLSPHERPNLATEVRPRLDLLTSKLLRLLKRTEPARANHEQCRAALTHARLAVQEQSRLDSLHRHALGVALIPVCLPDRTTVRTMTSR